MKKAQQHNTAELFTKEAEREVLESELRVKWVRLKLKLTDWLAQSTELLPIEGDYRAVKCVIDGICGLEKLIGADKPAPKQAQDQINTQDRVESLLKRLPVDKK